MVSQNGSDVCEHDVRLADGALGRYARWRACVSSVRAGRSSARSRQFMDAAGGRVQRQPGESPVRTIRKSKTLPARTSGCMMGGWAIGELQYTYPSLGAMVRGGRNRLPKGSGV
jgi:hypothetical protein